MRDWHNVLRADLAAARKGKDMWRVVIPTSGDSTAAGSAGRQRPGSR
jgi:hypothetical protein